MSTSAAALYGARPCDLHGHYSEFVTLPHYFFTVHSLVADMCRYCTCLSASACGKCDEVERALNMFTEMKHNGIEPDHVAFNWYRRHITTLCPQFISHSAHPCSMIATAARSFRMFEEAETLYHEMRSNALKPDDKVYASLILACR